MTDEEILAAVETGLRAQGRREAVIEPRVHLVPDPAFRGHFNVLRGYVAPLGVAGVKIVGDYADNYVHGLPSEMALLNLFDPRPAPGQARRPPRRARHHRHADGGADRPGGPPPGPAREPRPRPRGRARLRLLERAAPGPDLRLRGDPRPLPAAREPAGVRRAA